MADALKVISWVVLIVGWIVVVLWAIIVHTLQLAVGLGIAAAASWGLWAIVLGWICGVRRHIRHHLRMPVSTATFLEKEVGNSRLADLRRTLEFRYGDQDAEGNQRLGVDFTHRSMATLQSLDAPTESLKWCSAEAESGRFEVSPKNGVYLLSEDGRPYVITLREGADGGGLYDYEEEGVIVGKGAWLQVLASSLDDASLIINSVLREAGVQSVYRGKLLHVVAAPSGRGTSIRAAPQPEVSREQIVLPEGLLEVLHRTTSGRLERHRLLQRHGHSTKTGVLLHGPPGTGKTLICRYLMPHCQNHTAILFAAERRGTDSDDTVQLGDQDFDRAIHELVVVGGQLTAGILGFPDADG